MPSLDVLLIESRPGAGHALAAELGASGHRVHRCFGPPLLEGPSGITQSALCSGVVEHACPLDQGVDVALVAHADVLGPPGLTEAGVNCALRAGIPVVQDGPGALDPFGSVVTGTIDGDAVAACEQAVEEGFGALRQDVLARFGPMLVAEGIRPTSVSVRFEPAWPRLHVVVTGPECAERVHQALGVRVLDAVRAGPRRFDQVNVAYEVAASDH